MFSSSIFNLYILLVYIQISRKGKNITGFGFACLCCIVSNFLNADRNVLRCSGWILFRISWCPKYFSVDISFSSVAALCPDPVKNCSNSACGPVDLICPCCALYQLWQSLARWCRPFWFFISSAKLFWPMHFATVSAASFVLGRVHVLPDFGFPLVSLTFWSQMKITD